MTKTFEHFIKRSLFWLAWVLPLDIVKNIQGSSDWWTRARGWMWNPNENVNDLIYFLSWDLSWLSVTYCLVNIARSLRVHITCKLLDWPVFWFWLLSSCMMGLAWGKVADEFTHPYYWHSFEIAIDFIVLIWALSQMRRKLKENEYQ